MTEQPKFTPGPWDARIQRGHNHRDLGWIIEHGNGRIGWASLAYTDTNEEAKTTDPARAANAHLIAASPDMYAALERALNFIANTESEMGETLPCGDAARAALAKARGQA